MTEKPREIPAPKRIQSALRRGRRAVIIVAVVVALLAAALAVTLYFTSRVTFVDPADGVKYYAVKKSGAYVLRDTGRNVLRVNGSGNYVTAANTLVNVDPNNGTCTVVATVMTEGDETTRFDSLQMKYDVLLYPHIERAQITSIEVHNRVDSFLFLKFTATDSTGKSVTFFAPDTRPDLAVDSTGLFATLVNATGYTVARMRLDKETVHRYGYAEYGLPEDPDAAEVYFIISAEGGVRHKVIIGNPVPTGEGYYARYDDRENVYVLGRVSATEYYGGTEQALFGPIEAYIPPAKVSNYATNTNYFDVTDMKVIDAADPGTPIIQFSYSGSIDKRYNTFYSGYPYVTTGALPGYFVDMSRADELLYQMLTWQPTRVMSLERAGMDSDELAAWLDQYDLGISSHAYELEFTFNIVRTYDPATDSDNISKQNQEYHRILISPLQEDGTYNVYNICMLYNAETGLFDKPAMGYRMIMAIPQNQMNFLVWNAIDWVDARIFSDYIAYCDRIAVHVAPGGATFPAGRDITFYLDNSLSLAAEFKPDDNIPTDDMIVRDDSGTVIDTYQFKLFYKSLLYTALSGSSSLSETERQALIDTGDAGATLSIKLHFRLMKYNAATKHYEETGEVVEKDYCYYTSYTYPREAFTTLNGVGQFYTVRTRVEKVIRDIGKLYTGETIDPMSTY